MATYLLRDKDGQVVGEIDIDSSGEFSLAVESPGLSQKIRDYIDAQGIEAVPVEGNILAEECNEDRPRACDLSLTIALADDFARENGISAPSLRDLAQSMAAESEEQVRAALEELVRNAPQGPLREEAQGLYAYLFPTSGGKI